MSLTADLSDAFFVRWLLAAQELQCDPVDLISVAYSESGCRANAHNPHGDASGLIQFMPATLKGLGWTAGDASFRQLPAEDQAPFVRRYFAPWAFRTGISGQRIPTLLTAAHCYVATFLPACLLEVVAAGEGWRSVVLCARGGKLAWAYEANTVLDRDKDGKITAGDLAEQLERQCAGARWDEIVARLNAARELGTEPSDVRPDQLLSEPAIVHPSVPLPDLEERGPDTEPAPSA